LDPISSTIFAGNAHPGLARDIAYHLNLPLGRITVGRFSDGEISVEIMENVRGREVFIVQPTCPPVNEHLMELLIIADACQRASASRITAVVPYFGYGRQDRRRRAARVPITAKLVANLFATAGIGRVLTVDIHADQIQGFFDIPVDNVYASPVLLGDAWKQKYPDMVVVSPDVGGVERARALAKRLDDAGLAIIDKRRPQPNMAEVMNVIGEVAGKTCVLVDDMVDTAGTLCQAAAVLKQRGAIRVVAYITHPVLSGPAVERIDASELDEIVVTDTIPLNPEAKACGRIRQLSVAELLAETLRRINEAESVSSLYLD
jgi:ribose-phosphate pyrophosphokinase